MNGAEHYGGCPKDSLSKSIIRRCASLTEAEKSFLGALLLEGNGNGEELKSAESVLNDDILFSVPFAGNDDCEDFVAEKRAEQQPTPAVNVPEEHGGITNDAPKLTRSNVAQVDLWRAHQDGVAPKRLVEKSTSTVRQSLTFIAQKGRRKSGASLKNKATLSPEDNNGADSDSLNVQSDEEVGSIDHESDASSWSENEGGFNHYDAWEVLRDEYSSDFGFNVAVDDENKLVRCSSNIDERGIFKILGTSHDDTRSLPHVLSPPLMDSLLSFVPDRLSNDNLWLKYSLCRDGASLDILKRYCRAAVHTIVAIETTDGDVFGSFTSAPWQTNNRYFGTGESFLWRMRQNRNSPVSSLFDQAQLESEIDVFPYNGSNSYVQLCTSDKLALGGGGTLSPGLDQQEICRNEDEDVVSSNYGFGLALDRNLRHGSTSPSATFGNSALVSCGGEGGQTFDVMNLEVWALTSASTEKEAQRQELSMFFVRNSISSLSKMSTSPQDTSNSSIFSADDLNPETFYRRIGENDESELDRTAWNYANMMNPGSQYGSKPLHR